MSVSPALPEPAKDAKEHRRAQVRASVARHAARLSQLSSLEQAAYKARASLGESFDPYTPEERHSLECIRRLQSELQEAAASLNAQMTRRLERDLAKNAALVVLLAELKSGSDVRVSLKPH